MAGTTGRGRPRSTSPAVLEEAATELFLEQGYAATTIDDIASRAGISRSAFFAYHPSKAEVLWRELDAAVDRVRLERGATLQDVADAIVAAVAPWGSNVPWALRDHDVMGTTETLQSTVVGRLGGLVARIAAATAASDPDAQRRAWLDASSLVGTAASAVVAWSGIGRDRGDAAAFVQAALARRLVTSDVDDPAHGVVER